MGDKNIQYDQSNICESGYHVTIIFNIDHMTILMDSFYMEYEAMVKRQAIELQDLLTRHKKQRKVARLNNQLEAVMKQMVKLRVMINEGGEEVVMNLSDAQIPNSAMLIEGCGDAATKREETSLTPDL